MPTKRASSRGPSASSPTTTAGTTPALNALLIAAAIGYGLSLLIERRDLSWPPHELLSGLDTLAGCLAMVGPLVLWRRADEHSGVGELTWMVAGLMVWVFDLAAVARGEIRGLSWATPIEPEVLGPAVLAVMIAGWLLGRRRWSWTWTSLTGWLLGLIWVGMGVLAIWSSRQ